MANPKLVAVTSPALVHVMVDYRYPVCGCKDPMLVTSPAQITRFTEKVLCEICLRAMRARLVSQPHSKSR